MGCDLMWSDPDECLDGFAHSPRGCGYLFGGDVVKEFMHTNDMDMIARAHQLVMEGYKAMFDRSLVTVWSAPNYMYRCGNVASVLQIEASGSRQFCLFDSPGEGGPGFCGPQPA